MQKKQPSPGPKAPHPTQSTLQSPAFDPQGSYTGLPKDGLHPVQDADDL